ncbi:MAG: hypothetical protein R3313_00520 [Candidatus Saccharimonadales bacterium]|nr:hypothetical protein [Candidatus Saccharimonadales bacterium]
MTAIIATVEELLDELESGRRVVIIMDGKSFGVADARLAGHDGLITIFVGANEYAPFEPGAGSSVEWVQHLLSARELLRRRLNNNKLPLLDLALSLPLEEYRLQVAKTTFVESEHPDSRGKGKYISTPPRAVEIDVVQFENEGQPDGPIIIRALPSESVSPEEG